MDRRRLAADRFIGRNAAWTGDFSPFPGMRRQTFRFSLSTIECAKLSGFFAAPQERQLP